MKILADIKPDAIANLGVSRTFQNIELFENMTTLDNILIGAHRHINYGQYQDYFFKKN
jgi:branched-chain amino acid transport system ATP-binding protein